MRVCLVTSQFEKLGVEYISAALKQGGHEVRMAYDPRLFIDSFKVNDRLSRLFSLERRVVEEAVAQKADAYAISSLSPDWAWAKRISTALKQRTGKPVIIGGLHVSAATQLVLEHDDIDYTVTGEGEGAIVDLCDALEAGRDPVDMPNVGMRRDGQAIINPNRDLLEDLDELPFPDKSIYFDISDHFRKGYNIMAARGCPKSCSYCFNSWYKHQFPNKKHWVRARSVENVIEELERAKKDFDPGHVRFVDDDFLYDHEWFMEFAEQYEKRIGLPYRLFVDADSCDEESVRRLHETGCFEVEMGVQTIEHDVRTKIFSRGQIEGRIEEAIERFGRTDVTLVCDNIIGYPGQTPETMKPMLEFYNEHRPDRVQNLWLRYWPGATILGIAQKSGFLTDEEVRDVYENPSDRGCVLGNANKEEWAQRMASFLYLALYMPKWWNDFWIRNQRFTKFPKLPDLTSYALPNTLNSQISMYPVRMTHRYVRYGILRALWPLRRLVAKLFFDGRNPLMGKGDPRPRRSKQPRAAASVPTLGSVTTSAGESRPVPAQPGRL